MSPADPDDDRPDPTRHDGYDRPDPATRPSGPAEVGPEPPGFPGGRPLAGQPLHDPAPPEPDQRFHGAAPAEPGLPFHGAVQAEPLAEPRQPGRALVVGAATTVAIALLGAPLGLLWRLVAPSVPVVRTEDGAILAEPQPEQFIAADGWFSLLGVSFGVLVAIAVWAVLRRWRGPLGMVVVAVGGLGAALVAWRLGRQIGLADYHRLLGSAPLGRTFQKPPDLRAGGVEWLLDTVPVVRGDLLLPAFAAVVVYTLLAGWSQYPGLRPEPAPAYPPDLFPVDGGWAAPAPGVSSDSAAPPAPTAEPAPPGPDAAGQPRD